MYINYSITIFVEKFTFCPISRNRSKVFGKKWRKMSSLPSLKVTILWTILEVLLSQATKRAQGHKPQAGPMQILISV